MDKKLEQALEKVAAELSQDPERLMQEVSVEEMQRFLNSAVWKLVQNDLVERYEDINSRVNELTFCSEGIVTLDHDTTIAMRSQLLEIRFLLTVPGLLLEDLQARDRALAMKEKSDGRRDVSGR